MFKILKKRYEKNFVRKDQLQRYVGLGKITKGQYKLITGEEMTAQGCFFIVTSRKYYLKHTKKEK